MRIKRRRRVRCKLGCEIVLAGRRRLQGRVVSLSESGLAVVGDLRLDQGDAIRLLVHPGGLAPTIEVSGIVWNAGAAGGPAADRRLRRLDCVVSDPPQSLLGLLDRLEPKAPRPRRAEPIAIPRPRHPQQTSQPEPDLPRSRELPPPHKPEPEERLPHFQVRMKQLGGPRTRTTILRGRSATHAARLARDELARVLGNSEDWEVLEVARVSKP